MSGEAPTRRWDTPTKTDVDPIRRLEVGALLAGRYRILGLLGVGGIGMVYLADDEQLGLPVAVKVLRPDRAEHTDGDEPWLERFKQELVLARQVSHPNVVRIHDIGIEKGDKTDLVFLTMDFVSGRSLRDRLSEETRLPVDQAVAISRQLALGLGAAHAAGVVHRDLKPANVLLDTNGTSLRAAITDFGVARSLAGSTLTRPGTVIGTLGYLSPEQARGGTVDGRSDLYSLGLLFYEMLTGDLPFSDGTDVEVLAQRMVGVPRNLPWPGVKVPPRLREVVQRLLATDPARRYPTADDFIRDLDRSAAVSRFSFFASISPRMRRIAVAAGCLLALLAVGLTVRSRVRASGQAPRQIVPAGPRHAVALLPLADDTGRPDLAWVATGMPEMLASSLAESPELRVLDSRQVVRTLADLKVPAGPLPEPEARRLAGLLDADRLVTGRVHSVGGRLRIDLTLAANVPGLPLTTLHAEAAEGEAFRLVEQLGNILRQQLAVPPPEVEVAASHSPAALADYAQGAASLARGDALAAVPALERAVAADPLYTAAWVDLARAREALGHSEPAREAARRAVETLGPGVSRASDEARAVEARLLGRPDRAQEILSRLLTRYPDDVEARIELAEAYGQQGSLDRAITALKEVVSRAPHHPRALYLLGKYAVLAGNARQAADDYLVRALVLQNELGSEQGRADVLHAFGVAYRELGQLDRAVESYEQAAAVRKKIGDERGYAMTLRNLAAIHTMRGELAAAEAQLNEALSRLQKLGDKPGIAEVYNDFGALAEQRGDYGEALERYRQSLRARRDLGDDLALAQSFSNVGFACYMLGRYDDALVYWRQGLDLAKKSADPGGIILATQNLGLLELARGSWDDAIKSYLTALRSSRELGMKETTAISLGYLGRLYQYQGRPSAALASYGEALEVLRELGDRRIPAEFILEAAETELELGMTDAAEARLRAAADLLREGKNREQQAELDRLHGELLLARSVSGIPGDRAAAAADLRRAVAEAKESHSVIELLSARLSAAGLAERGREALTERESLLAEAETLGHARLRLRAAELVAQAALAAGDTERAQAAARAGLDLSATCGGTAGAWRLHGLLALALEKSGRSAEAAVERRRALEEIARVSRDLTPEQRKSFDRFAEVQTRALP